jgi:hypothetical protein
MALELVWVCGLWGERFLGKGPARLLVEDNNGDALGLTSLVGGFVMRALPLFWGGFN